MMHSERLLQRRGIPTQDRPLTGTNKTIRCALLIILVLLGITGFVSFNSAPSDRPQGSSFEKTGRTRPVESTGLRSFLLIASALCGMNDLTFEP